MNDLGSCKRTSQGLLPNGLRIAQSFIFGICFLALAGSTMWAQLRTGSITGVVTDPSGAVVPNAKVTLTDVARGITYEATTNSVGRYLFSSLPPTTYKLSVAATGFQTAEIPTITLDVNQNAEANVTLKVGQAVQVVEVRAGAVALQTQDAAVGQEINSTFINDLPLVGRSIYDLAMLAPGVSTAIGVAYGPGAVGANNFVSMGSRNAQADILLDGVTTTNYEQNTGFVQALYTPSVDAVQEFKMQQTNFSAEFGYSGATVVNVVTRSGSNAFHGAAYEYDRNTFLNSENYFLKQEGAPNPPYHWNDFGGTIGGPIKKNKIFFFYDFEGWRIITPAVVTLGLPTVAERAGDFSALCTSLGGSFSAAGVCSNPQGQIWDPYMVTTQTGYAVRTTPIPNNNMATYTSSGSFWNGGYSGTSADLTPLPTGAGNLINPVAKAILGYIPPPNVPGAGLNNNYLGSGGTSANGNRYDAKADIVLTTRDNLSLRFSETWGNGLYANIFGNPFDANTQGPNNYVNYEGAVNYTRTISPKTLVTVSIGATHSWSHTHGVSFDETTIGLPANVAYSNKPAAMQAPAIVLDGYSGENGNASFGGQPWSVMLYGQDVAQVMGTVSHVVGGHELKMGGEFREHRTNFTQYGLPAGHWEFQPGGTSGVSNNPVVTGGDSIASFLTGFATGWNSYEIPPSPATVNHQFAGFFQDNWHASKKLTINLGLRYDLDKPRTERFNRMSYFNPNLPSPIASAVSGVPASQCPACDNLMGAFEYVGGTNPRSQYNTYYGAVGPRFGFAYDFGHNTVVRGGFGLYYDPGKTGSAGAGSGAAGFQGYDQQDSWTTYDGETSNYPAYESILGQPVSIALPPGKSQGVYTQLFNSLTGIPIPAFNYLPREYSWSAGVQHMFPGRILLDVEYVGEHGSNLYLGGDIYDLDHISSATAANFISNPSAYTSYVPMPAQLVTAIEKVTPAYSNAAWSGSWQGFDAFLPYPQYAWGPWGTSGIQNVDPPIARSNYHALQVRAEKQYSNGLQFLVTYSAQKSMDDASIAGSNVWVNGIAGATLASVQDPNNLGAQYSLSQWNISQILQGGWVYTIPYGKGLHFAPRNDVLNAILGNWVVSGGYRYDTGQPILLGLSGATDLPGYTQRPNLNAPLIKNQGVNLSQYFSDPGAVSMPAPYVDGTAPRVLSGITVPGTNNWNLCVMKDFKLTESVALRLRWETFNMFNHVQFGAPNSTFNSANFGMITSQANSPLIQQLSLRLTF